MKKLRILSVFGTRPEAIKMCPLVKELERNEHIRSIVCVTGQHREMLFQVLDAFQVKADYNLGIMKPRQTVTSITSDVLSGLPEVFLKAKPDLVLVHGDTTTSMAAALAAFYAKIPVGHVEAGLRTYNKYAPFPEEMNRVLISRLADYHFAPTENNEASLAKEGIKEGIFVTGNTGIDSFRYTVKEDYVFQSAVLNEIDYVCKRVILMTAHRRENLGEPLKNICEAAKQICECHPEVELIYPMHLNPAVREIAVPILSGLKNVHLLNPIDVMDMHNLMNRCYMVMTDSGGLQEEAPHLGKPVLVLRTETERPEAVEAGTVRVVGVERETVVQEAERLLDDAVFYAAMSRAINPYGDGHASERITEILAGLACKGRDIRDIETGSVM